MEQSPQIGCPTRSGVSLLEVLISVGVLSIGLLGVAAVIPLGHHQMMEATKSDRAAACGQAGLHEVKIRGWLNPAEWRQMAVNELDPITTNWAPYTFPVTYDTESDGDADVVSPYDLAIPLADSFAIDPRFFAQDSTNVLVWRFPLDATAESTLTYERRSSLVRVTFDVNDLSVTPPAMAQPFTKPLLAFGRLPVAAANRVFTWRDDMLFPVPTEADDRPRQMVIWDGGQGFAYPRHPADKTPLSATTPVLSQADDNYTWMATVTPILNGPGHDFWVQAPIPSSHSTDTTPPTLPNTWASNAYYRSHSYLNTVTRYTVSIVVFYKRDFECPTDLTDPAAPPQERSVQAYFPGDGYGGGDVLLMTVNGSWLEVKKNDWLMLRGLEMVGPIQGTPAAALEPFRRVVAKWYRVIAVDEVIDGNDDPADAIPPNSFGRYVTLSGPDWRVDGDADGVFEPLTDDPAIATLVDNVIGVYTTTMETN